MGIGSTQQSDDDPMPDAAPSRRVGASCGNSGRRQRTGSTLPPPLRGTVRFLRVGTGQQPGTGSAMDTRPVVRPWRGEQQRPKRRPRPSTFAEILRTRIRVFEDDQRSGVTLTPFGVSRQRDLTLLASKPTGIRYASGTRACSGRNKACQSRRPLIPTSPPTSHQGEFNDCSRPKPSVRQAHGSNEIR